jgi:Helicase HerA, central domain
VRSLLADLVYPDAMADQPEPAALATCVDGPHFTYAVTPDALDVAAGGYVVVDRPAGPCLGQVTGISLAERDGVRARPAIVEGRVLDGPRGPFHAAPTRAATTEEVAAWLERTRPDRATLHVGSLASAPGLPLELDAGAFRRHTFLCGQSGSGKTYALGTMLERLLLETRLRVVILDPNSDFVRLDETREGTAPDVAAEYTDATRDLVVRRAADSGADRIHVRFSDFDAAEQGATLRLDPIADRDEYAALVDLAESAAEGATSFTSAGELAEALRASAEVSVRELGLRVTNLGIHRWQIWSMGDEGSLQDDVAPGGPRALVVDLGSLETPQEKALAAEAVLAALWRRRAAREPTLIVIDEAHNVCPAAPSDPLTALATEHVVRIAGEGRKFGLTLLVSTQRPQKVHENVISQCDNLVLMRINSISDLGVVSDLFSFVPAQLLARAREFGLGEAVVAGGLVSHPTFGRFGPRWSVEGGSDPPSEWARARRTGDGR